MMMAMAMGVPEMLALESSDSEDGDCNLLQILATSGFFCKSKTSGRQKQKLILLNQWHWKQNLIM